MTVWGPANRGPPVRTPRAPPTVDRHDHAPRRHFTTAARTVRHRVMAGGHDVPEHKIRERHRRLWGLVVTAMALADNATVYDNAQRKGPRIVAQLSGGVVVGSPLWPRWTPEPLRTRWPN
jgi:hypothetical protein